MVSHTENSKLMDTKLSKHLEALNADLSKLLEELKNYTEADLNRPPKEGAWSVLQVMHHLIKAEALGQQYVEKKLSFSPKLKKKGLLTYFRYHSLSLFMNSPFKRKAPKNIGDEVLPAQSSFWETAKQWKQQREDLAIYLNSLPQEYVNMEIYKHPAIGRLSLDYMIRFYRDHFRRHRKQIKKALVFPPSRNK